MEDKSICENACFGPHSVCFVLQCVQLNINEEHAISILTSVHLLLGPVGGVGMVPTTNCPAEDSLVASCEQFFLWVSLSCLFS